MLRFIPNILTFGRLVLTVIFILMILFSSGRYPQTGGYPGYLDWAFIIFIIAGITDIIDGAAARKLNVTSRFGRMVDPLADKILVCGSFICFAIIGEPTLFGFPKPLLLVILWIVAGILILREVYVTVLRHFAEAKGINFAATFSGKIKMFLQSFAIGTVIIKMAYFNDDNWAYWFTTVVYVIMLAVTVISGLRATQRTSWKEISSRNFVDPTSVS